LSNEKVIIKTALFSLSYVALYKLIFLLQTVSMVKKTTLF